MKPQAFKQISFKLLNIGLVLLFTFSPTRQVLAAAGDTTRISVDSSGVQGNNSSGNPSISADGHYVAFDSNATNLVPGDTNGQTDIFMRDQITGATSRVSVNSSGAQANCSSYQPSISADGRYVAFESCANNLVAGDTNVWDIFVHDLTTGMTTRVSVDSSSAQANGGSYFSSISSDGRYIAFHSLASNLVAGDTNGVQDIFVHDRVTGATRRVSVDSSGAQANCDSSFSSISADGRYVAFDSCASNLVAGDTNGERDIFVRNLITGTTTRISVDSSGAQANGYSEAPSISADGRFVAFESGANNLVAGSNNLYPDIFVHDLNTGATRRVSVNSSGGQANGTSHWPSISSDGNCVAFESNSTNLVPGNTDGNTDIFLHNQTSGATIRVSVNSSGLGGNDDSLGASISANCQYVAFRSFATNLVPGDTNNFADVFISEPDTSPAIPVTINQAAGQTDPTNTSPINFTVVFGEPVTGFTTGDVDLSAGTAPGTLTGTVTEIAPHDGTTFNVAVTGMTGDGTVIANIPRRVAQNAASFLNQAATSTDNRVLYDTGFPAVFSTVPAQNAVLQGGLTQLIVEFSEDVLHDGTTHAANNALNYLLVEYGANHAFDTLDCKDGVVIDDTLMSINSVTYQKLAGTFWATLHFNSPLPAGTYRLFVCGTTSIHDLAGNTLNNGLSDSLLDFTVQKAVAAAAAVPATGFAPDRVTILPPQSVSYADLGDLWLEIPKLGVQMPIVGVPQSADGTWDVSWLGKNAGWLNGSAFPTWKGNSVITGHVYDAYGQPGSFRYLNTLWWGDKVILHAWGVEYVYEVRAVTQVSPGNVSAMMKHEERSWLTLVTCRGYNEASNSYQYRMLVRAVLVEVK